MKKQHKCFVIDTNETSIMRYDRYEYLYQSIKDGFESTAKQHEAFLRFDQDEVHDVIEMKMKHTFYGLYMIEVMIHEKVNRFMLDTGANMTTITKECADNIQLETSKHQVPIQSFGGSERNLSYGKIDSLYLSTHEIRNLSVLMTESIGIQIPYLNINILGLDGILGWDVLSTLDFELDDKNKKFRILPIKEYSLDANLVPGLFPSILMRGPHHQVSVMGFDSGAQRSWISDNIIKKYQLVDEGEIKMYAVGVHGMEDILLHMVEDVRFKFGKSHLVLQHVSTGRTKLFPHFEYEAVLGNEIFKNRKMIFLNSVHHVSLD